MAIDWWNVLANTFAFCAGAVYGHYKVYGKIIRYINSRKKKDEDKDG